jgi:hypothetical protein
MMRRFVGLCSVLVGAGILLSPWYSFHPFPWAEWAESAMPLFMSGSVGVFTSSTSTISSIPLAPFGGIVYAALLLLMLATWRGDAFGRVSWMTALLATSPVLLGISVILPGTLTWLVVRIGFSALFGLVLVFVGVTAGGDAPSFWRADCWICWLFVAAGALTVSFILLPLGLLFLATAHMVLGGKMLVGTGMARSPATIEG